MLAEGSSAAAAEDRIRHRKGSQRAATFLESPCTCEWPDIEETPAPLPARHRALRDGLVAPLDLHDPLLEQLAKNARGVQPLEAADRVEVLERDLAVDLGQHESGARIEVQPDDLVRRNGGA